jgi:hypothetical protein
MLKRKLRRITVVMLYIFSLLFYKIENNKISNYNIVPTVFMGPVEFKDFVLYIYILTLMY